MRKDWDTYFMDIAFMARERSTCPRLHVGAVIVKNKQIKSTGYNGSPKGLPHCDEDGCFMVDDHCRRTIHAEINAITNASPEEREGATLYVTHQPCIECQKVIISSGITRVVFAKGYMPEWDWLKLAKHIETEQLKGYHRPSFISAADKESE